jgi:hypothetical protein
MTKNLSFHNSSFALKILFNVNGKATVWHTPCFWVQHHHHVSSLYPEGAEPSWISLMNDGAAASLPFSGFPLKVQSQWIQMANNFFLHKNSTRQGSWDLKRMHACMHPSVVAQFSTLLNSSSKSQVPQNSFIHKTPPKRLVASCTSSFQSVCWTPRPPGRSISCCCTL